MNRIIYNKDNQLKILCPAIDEDILVLAEKDVPAGLPFKIIPVSELPSDRSTRNAWYIDDSELTDGVGLTKEQFVAKYPHLSHWAVIE